MALRRLLVISLFIALCQLTYGQKKKKESPLTEKLAQDIELKAESSFIEGEKQLVLENYTKAYDLFLLSLELSPDNPVIHFKISEVLVKNGDPAKGLEHIDKAIDLDPTNKYYYIFKSDIQKAEKDYQGAANTLEEMIRLIPGNENFYYDLAAIYQFQNKWDLALKYYDLVEKEFGLTESILYEKQKIYLKQNNMDMLIADWDRLIADNPYEPSYVLELCNILISNNMLEEARRRLKDFNTQETRNPNVYLLLSEISRKQGDFKESLSLLKAPIESPEVEVLPKIQLLNNYLQIARINDLQEEIIVLLELLIVTHSNIYEAVAFGGDAYFQLEDFKKARELYLSAVEIDPGIFGAWQNIISIDAQNEEYDSLISHTGRALEYFPNQSILYYYNGVGNYMQENYRDAIRSLEQGKKYTSDKDMLSVFYGQLGDAYHSAENFEKSYDSYELALDNDPDNDHVLNNYSYYLSLEGAELDKAKTMSEKLIKANPDNGTYLDTYGWVLYMRGEYLEAEEILKKASELIEDGTVLEHYGDVLFKLGKVQQAVEQWEKAKNLGGTTDNIDKKIEERMIYE